MDNIKNPPHYVNSEIEPIDYIIKNKLTYCEGNVVKYITRWRKKGGIEDLKKAKQYIDIIIEKEGVPTVTDTKD
jgi:bacterioferritin (cytochrome b1)